MKKRIVFLPSCLFPFFTEGSGSETEVSIPTKDGSLIGEYFAKPPISKKKIPIALLLLRSGEGHAWAAHQTLASRLEALGMALLSIKKRAISPNE